MRGNSTFDNISDRNATQGANLHIPGSVVTVYFPLLAGHWLPNSECRVYREPCALTDYACQASVDACSLVADNSAEPATVPKTKCTGQYASSCSDPQRCSQNRFVQPCDWKAHPRLLTNPPTKIYTPPIGVPIDVAFPYKCAPGILGSAHEEYQISALCQSKCPAGSYCPNETTTQALACPKGS